MLFNTNNFMKIRKSKLFGNYNEKEKDIILRIITRFPEKWILIDSETDQIYKGCEDDKIGKNWKNIDDKLVLKKIRDLIKGDL